MVPLPLLLLLLLLGAARAQGGGGFAVGGPVKIVAGKYSGCMGTVEAVLDGGARVKVRRDCTRLAADQPQLASGHGKAYTYDADQLVTSEFDPEDSGGGGGGGQLRGNGAPAAASYPMTASNPASTQLAAGAVTATATLNLNPVGNNAAHGTARYADRVEPLSKGATADMFPRLGEGRLIVRRGWTFECASKGGPPVFAFRACGQFEGVPRGEMQCADPAQLAWSEFLSSPRTGVADVYDITVPANTPVGVYIARSPAATSAQDQIDFVVVFNPVAPQSEVGGAPSLLYAQDDTTLLYKGASNDHYAVPFQLDNWVGLQLIAAINLLSELPLNARRSAVAVSRELTRTIGSQVCYGEWKEEGSYTTGRPERWSEDAGKWETVERSYKCSRKKSEWDSRCRLPESWRGAGKIVEQHMSRLTRSPEAPQVQYCQVRPTAEMAVSCLSCYPPRVPTSHVDGHTLPSCLL